MKRPFCASRLMASVVAPIVLLSRTALAAEPSPEPSASTPEVEAEAQAAMERGIAAFGKGDAATALSEYERAIKLVPRANLPYRYAAEALVQLDRPSAAIAYLEKYLAKNEHVSDAEAVRERIRTLRREKLPSVVTLRADEPHAFVRVDGGAVHSLPTVMELSPGDHVLSFEFEGRRRVSQTVHVVGDQATTLDFKASMAPQLDVPSSPASRGVGPVGVASLATLGVGVAGLGVSVLLDATLLKSKLDALETASKSNARDLAAVQSDASRVRTGVAVGYVASGVVTLVGGALLFYWQVSKSGSAHARSAPLTWTF